MCRPWTLVACLVAVVAMGCEEDRVEVRVVLRTDGSFERVLRLWREETEKPGEVRAPAKELVAGAAAVHGEAEPSKDASVTFRGEFRAVPADLCIGDWENRGGYSVWRTGLGSFAIYRERRPGPTDFTARAHAMEKGVDLLARVLRRMFRDELKGEPGLDPLLEFLRGPFREDLKDLLHLLAGSDGPQAALGLEDRSGATGTAVALAVSLLQERGYVKLEELLVLHSFDELVLARVREAIAARMGQVLDAPLGRRLAFLEDEGAFDRAREGIGLTAEEFEDRLEPVVDVLTAVNDGSGPEIRYEVVLPPAATVIESSGQVLSGGPVTRTDRFDARPVRSLTFVAFAVPDLDWQQDHFGGRILDGTHLRDYALWIAGLPGDTRERWEEAMEKVAPGRDLWPTIRDIRVSGLPEGEMEEGARIFAEAYGPEPR